MKVVSSFYFRLRIGTASSIHFRLRIGNSVCEKCLVFSLPSLTQRLVEHPCFWFSRVPFFFSTQRLVGEHLLRSTELVNPYLHRDFCFFFVGFQSSGFYHFRIGVTACEKRLVFLLFSSCLRHVTSRDPRCDFCFRGNPKFSSNQL